MGRESRAGRPVSDPTYRCGWDRPANHRFGIAPEIKPDTYELDNVPVTSEALPSGLCTRQPAGDRLQISKKMEITLASDANRVTSTASA